MTGPRKIIIQVFLNIVDNSCVSRFVISFQRENVVALSVNDLLGNLFLVLLATSWQHVELTGFFKMPRSVFLELDLWTFCLVTIIS